MCFFKDARLRSEGHRLTSPRCPANFPKFPTAPPVLPAAPLTETESDGLARLQCPQFICHESSTQTQKLNTTTLPGLFQKAELLPNFSLRGVFPCIRGSAAEQSALMPLQAVRQQTPLPAQTHPNFKS